MPQTSLAFGNRPLLMRVVIDDSIAYELHRPVVIGFLLTSTLTVQALAATGSITFSNQVLTWEDKRAPALARAHLHKCNELYDELVGNWLGPAHLDLTDIEKAQVFFAVRLGLIELMRAPKKMEFTKAAAGAAVASAQMTISELYY